VKALVATVVSVVSGFLLLVASCERGPAVQAAEEEIPGRSSQPPSVSNSSSAIDGELLSVDVAAMQIVIRVENGMAQTFNWDDRTDVTGLTSATNNAARSATAQLRRLAGRIGSDVSVQWRDDEGEKLATSINITYLMPGKAKRTRRRSKR
jgi:hypothetical protein